MLQEKGQKNATKVVQLEIENEELQNEAREAAMSLMIMQRMAGTSVNRSGTVLSVTEESRYTDDADYETDFERLPNVP